jgi:CRISPR-associated protein Csb1
MKTWNYKVAISMLAAKGPAALVCRQWLVPAEGREAVIFPPTFAAAEGSEGEAGYNIDPLGDPDDPKTPRVAILDTVGSQANRMEPLFKKMNGEDTSYSRLVPQIEIKAGNKIVHLLDVAHRAADTIARYSELGPELREAFDAYQEVGDATRLAKLAPTSLVFGAWDSRDTQAKLPRLLASTIRAYDVVELTRSAQYIPPVDYFALGVLEDVEDKKVRKAASALGFRHAPAVGKPGGVVVRGEIRRETILSLVGLRAIGPKGSNGDALRRYVLGLAMVAMTYDRPHDLRQGCLLVSDPDKRPVWKLVAHDGARKEFAVDPGAALTFAKDAAKTFGIGESKTVNFDARAANQAIKDKVDEMTKAKKAR